MRIGQAYFASQVSNYLVLQIYNTYHLPTPLYVCMYRLTVMAKSHVSRCLINFYQVLIQYHEITERQPSHQLCCLYYCTVYLV